MARSRHCRLAGWKRHAAVSLAVVCLAIVCGGCEDTAENSGTEAAHRTEQEERTESTGQTEPTESVGQPFVELGMADMVAKGEVRLPVELVHNDGFSGIHLEIIYDNTVLEFGDIEFDDSLRSCQGLVECTEVPGSNIVRVSYISTQEITETGRLAVVSFRLKPDVEDGISAAVEVRLDSVARLDGRRASGSSKCVQILIGE